MEMEGERGRGRGKGKREKVDSTGLAVAGWTFSPRRRLTASVIVAQAPLPCLFRSYGPG